MSGWKISVSVEVHNQTGNSHLFSEYAFEPHAFEKYVIFVPSDHLVSSSLVRFFGVQD